MRIGFGNLFPGEGPTANVGFIRDVARALEDIGFASLWVGEHLAFFPGDAPDYPNGAWGRKDVESLRGVLDPYILLGAVAMETTRLHLGLGITLVGERNPLLTAREAATVDLLSNGRLWMGIGIGWSRPEYEAVGVPWERRGARVDEYLRVMRELWETELTSFSGEFVRFEPLHAFPKPIQKPGPPVLIGGNGDAAIRRIVRHPGSGWYGSNLEIDEIEQFMTNLAAQLAPSGRDLSEVELVVARRTQGAGEDAWMADRAFIEKCAGLGIDEVVCRPRLGPDFSSHIAHYAEIVGVTPTSATTEE